MQVLYLASSTRKNPHCGYAGCEGMASRPQVPALSSAAGNNNSPLQGLSLQGRCLELGEHMEKRRCSNLGLPPGAMLRVRLVGQDTEFTVQTGGQEAQWENHLHAMVDLEGAE